MISKSYVQCINFVLTYLLRVDFIVERFDEVEDSLCVGQPTHEGERVVLFLKMANGYR